MAFCFFFFQDCIFERKGASILNIINTHHSVSPSLELEISSNVDGLLQMCLVVFNRFSYF
jgi:hypothetical protein